jgi:hypothetical protein
MTTLSFSVSFYANAITCSLRTCGVPEHVTHCSINSYKTSCSKILKDTAKIHYSVLLPLTKFQCNGAVVLTVDKTGVADDRRESCLPVYQLGKEVRRPLLKNWDIG